uniref:C2H2-type domain-containing protein n=1 Tax=Timema bartmani TaxID=61472 RepID=A0A7R9ESC9_9NEOP|nr:unnamed protein product [Timema bartmani]
MRQGEGGGWEGGTNQPKGWVHALFRMGGKFWKPTPEHCLQFNNQDEVTDDTSHFMSSLQEYRPRAVKDNYDKSDTLSLLIDAQNLSYKHKSLKCFVCPQCARIYQRKQSLYLHQKHECGKEPQFVCPYCTYRAKLKGNLLTNEPFLHSFTPSNILSSFKKTGIAPFDSQVFSEKDFAPSPVTATLFIKEMSVRDEVSATPKTPVLPST